MGLPGLVALRASALSLKSHMLGIELKRLVDASLGLHTPGYQHEAHNDFPTAGAVILSASDFEKRSKTKSKIQKKTI